jgi:hypothetical protein
LNLKPEVHRKEHKEGEWVTADVVQGHWRAVVPSSSSLLAIFVFLVVNQHRF